MKKCTNKDCGKQIEVKADFCDYCGARQIPENPDTSNNYSDIPISVELDMNRVMFEKKSCGIHLRVTNTGQAPIKNLEIIISSAEFKIVLNERTEDILNSEKSWIFKTQFVTPHGGELAVKFLCSYNNETIAATRFLFVNWESQTGNTVVTLDNAKFVLDGGINVQTQATITQPTGTPRWEKLEFEKVKKSSITKPQKIDKLESKEKPKKNSSFFKIVSVLVVLLIVFAGFYFTTQDKEINNNQPTTKKKERNKNQLTTKNTNDTKKIKEDFNRKAKEKEMLELEIKEKLEREAKEREKLELEIKEKLEREAKERGNLELELKLKLEREAKEKAEKEEKLERKIREVLEKEAQEKERLERTIKEKLERERERNKKPIFTVSSESVGNPLKLAFDGNDDTYWQATSSKATVNIKYPCKKKYNRLKCIFNKENQQSFPSRITIKAKDERTGDIMQTSNKRM